MEYYIGMDAHSKTSVMCEINGRGQHIMSQRINTSEREIEKFLSGLKGKKHLTFEESQMSRWLHIVLKDRVDELLICNPAFIAKKRGPKNDNSDAEHLAQQLRGGHLIPVFHDDSDLSDLRRVVSAYEQLMGDIVRAKNRLKSLFVARAINVQGRKVYSDETVLDQLDEPSRVVAKKLFAQVGALEGIKAEYKSIFEKNACDQAQIEVLTTIPGISAVRANIIAAAVCDPKRFPNKNKFWSYCMLVKHDQQSDGRSYGKVTIFGKMSLKTVFMGAALSVIQHDDGALRKFYDYQRLKGLEDRAAKKNLARKIAAIALTIMRTTEAYQERKAFDEKSDLILN